MKRIIFAVCAIVITATMCISALAASEPAGGSIEAFFEENKETISGAAVMLIENGGITGEYYYGLADIENNVAVDKSTVFEWGSITKVLTWTSVMQLVERGDIELDRDIREYLPEGFLSRLSCGKPITMLNLMNHNAGWAEVNGDVFVYNSSKVMDLGDALKKQEPRQIFEPGSVVAYSNYGVALAGYIVERVSGKPCWQYINENIFAPLGIEHTSVHPTQSDRPDVAAQRDSVKGYDYKRNYIVDHRGYCSMYPAGSAIGTIEDMARFVMALMPPEGSNSLLFENRETLERMLTPSLYYPDNSSRNAHGFWIEWRGGKTFFGHGGNSNGFSSNALFAPDMQKALLVMTNTAGEYVLCSELADQLLGELSLPYETEIGVGTAKEVTGIYQFTRIFVDTFRVVDYRLFDPIIVKAKDDTTIEMSFLGEYEQVAPYVFLSSEYGTILRFGSENGKVNKIAMTISDFIKRPMGQVVFDYSLFGLVLVSMVCCLVTLCASGLRKIRMKPEKSRLRVIRNSGCAFLLAVGVNWLLPKLVIEDILANDAVLITFLIINALTLPAFMAYAWFFIKTEKKKYSRGDVQLSVVTGLCLLTGLIAVITFNLWR